VAIEGSALKLLQTQVVRNPFSMFNSSLLQHHLLLGQHFHRNPSHSPYHQRKLHQFHDERRRSNYLVAFYKCRRSRILIGKGERNCGHVLYADAVCVRSSLGVENIYSDAMMWHTAAHDRRTWILLFVQASFLGQCEC
jgi:hypothetical protein